MKKVISSGATWLVLTILTLSCASLAKPLIPLLAKRTLRIHPSKPGVFYDYCVKRAWIGDKCKEWKTDFYDFTDEKTRLKLSNMGFRLRVLRR